MKAAVLHEPEQAPQFENFSDPTLSEDEVAVDVRAASLKQIDRSMASDSHYGSHGDFPSIPGVDGVGVLEDGTRVYCGGTRPPYGMMAEKAAVPLYWELPDEVDDITAAALPNPAISSWLPFADRADLQQGETVLILGATGTAGKLAVQIANLLGAGRVIGAGRNEEALAELIDLGADATIQLEQSDEDLTDAFVNEGDDTGFDVVIDYVWGHPTERFISALIGDDLFAEGSPIRLVQVGAMAGSRISLPAEALRSSGLEIHGSGGGSVSMDAMHDAFEQVMDHAAAGNLTIDAEEVPLSDVEEAWTRETRSRLVFVP